MFKPEVAELLQKDGRIFEWAERVHYGRKLTEEDMEISEVMDSFAKEIGNTGRDKDMVLSAFIKKVVTPDVWSVDDSLISNMFNIGTVGEFDEKIYNKIPKNTLKVYDAVRGGNVPKSYLNAGLFTPQHFGLQVETVVKFSDLRRNGFKSIAQMIIFAEEALNNQKYFKLLSAVNTAISASGITGQVTAMSDGNLTKAGLDALVLYLQQFESNPNLLGSTKYTSQIADMTGFNQYMSDDMKNELNRTGLIPTYRGANITGVPENRKTGNGETIVPIKTIMGVAGKIGDLDMRGEMRVYQEENINTEEVHIKITGFDVDYVIYDIEKIAKITFGA